MKPKLLVFELWGMGDLVLATPFLRAAAGSFEVTLLAKPTARQLQPRLWPGVEVIPFDFPWTAFRHKYDFPRWPWRELAALLRAKKLSATIATAKLAPAVPLETNPELPLVRQFLNSVGQTKTLGVDYFCDAAVLAAVGIPSVVFGPGNIAQAHTSDEWISLAELERGKNLLLRFLRTLP